MASIPQMKYYMDLVNGIGHNCANLKSIELYADSQYKLKTLGMILKTNTILREIKLNIIDWNGSEDNMGNDTGSTDKDLMLMCDKVMDVMMDNQMYLERQMKGMIMHLKNICQFPNGLCLNVMDYIYPHTDNMEMNEYCLMVEVVMNCENETHDMIHKRFTDKLAILREKIDIDFVKRNLKFKISKPWPG